jgi:hypothetical protein
VWRNIEQYNKEAPLAEQPRSLFTEDERPSRRTCATPYILI